MSPVVARQGRLLGIPNTALRLSMLWLSACMGGQSGSEGSLPAAPCAGNSAFVVGHISEVGGGCVSVEVDQVVAAGQPTFANDGQVMFDHNPAVGAVLRGRLGTVYSYRHEFRAAESVAALIESWDDTLHLQLFPFEAERVQVQWGRHYMELGLEEMTAPDCAEKLMARLTPENDVGASSPGSVQVAPPLPDAVCTP